MEKNQLLHKIYQNAKMGEQTMKDLLTMTKEQPIRDLMEEQRKGYTAFADRAEKTLNQYNQTPEENGMMTKLMAEMGIKMNYIKDNSPSHLAEMMIQGSTMGITQTTQELHKSEHVEPSVKELAKDVITFEQNNIEQLKRFL